MIKHLFLAALVCLVVVPAAADEPDLGVPQHGSVHSTLHDNLNRENLNVNFAIPVIAKPGRGLDFAHNIVYDSLIWRVRDVNNTGAYAWMLMPDGGWKTGVVNGQLTKQTPRNYRSFNLIDDECEVDVRRDNYVYTDISGVAHPFDVYVERFRQYCSESLVVTGVFSGYALDGSGLFLQIDDVGNGTVSFGDGTVNSSDLDGRITDRNGNQITKTSTDDMTEWTDTLGLVALRVVEDTGSTSFQHQDQDGNYTPQTTVQLNYQDFAIKTAFGCPGVAEFEATAQLPVSANLPDGTSYQFEYEDTPGFSGFTTARLRRMVLPRGGEYEYTYLGDHGGVNCADGTNLHVLRRINDGSQVSTWEFRRTQLGTGNWQTVQTDPQLPYDPEPNESVYEFGQGFMTHATFHQGRASSGVVLRSTLTERDAVGRPVSSIVVLDDGTQAKTEIDYDARGNTTAVREYGWGAGTPGALLTTRQLTYIDTPEYRTRRIYNLLSQSDVYEGSVDTGTLRARTIFAYDEYDASAGRQFTCVTDAPQHLGSFGCDFTVRGNLTSTTRYAKVSDPANPADALSEAYHYDSVGNLRRTDVQGTLQQRREYSVSTGYAFPGSVQHGPDSGPNLVTTSTYNSFLGALTGSTDVNGNYTSLQYDALNRPISVTRPDGQLVSTTYDDATGAATVETPVQDDNRRLERVELDPLGRAARVVLTDNGTPPVVYSIMDIEFDGIGRAHRRSLPHLGSNIKWTNTRFDGLGRPTMTFGPNGSSEHNNVTTEFAGYTMTVTDEVGAQRVLHHDARGLATQVVEHDPKTGTLSAQTVHEYDSLGNRITTTMGAQTRVYTYDALGRRVSTEIPETSGSDLVEYNPLGLIGKTVDVRGVETTITYDALNRVVEIDHDVSAAPGVAAAPATYVYGSDPAENNNGRLVSMIDVSGSETLSYDWAGRVTRVDKEIDGESFQIEATYNPGGAPVTTRYPSGRTLVASYDPIGRITQLDSATDGTTYVRNLSYDAAGQLTSLEYGNGVVGTRSYDPDTNQLSDLRYANASGGLFDLRYEYDLGNGNDGRIRRVEDRIEPGRTSTYDYDPLGRLRSARSDGDAVGCIEGPPSAGGGGDRPGDMQKNNTCTPVLPDYAGWQLDWLHDRYGNIESQHVVTSQNNGNDPPTPGYQVVVDSTSNRIQSAGFAYDANGNLESDGSFNASYNANDSLAGIDVGDYENIILNDGRGFRVKSSVGTESTVFVRDGERVLAEVRDDQAHREFVYLGSLLIATHDGLSRTFHHQDHLSIRLSTDESGNVRSEQGHYPYGEAWYRRGSVETDRAFTTYERSEQTGLDHAVFREYSPATSRFLSADPLAGTVSNPQSLNRYAYVRNDPINLVDPLGLQAHGGAIHPWEFGPLAQPNVQRHLVRAAAWGGLNLAVGWGQTKLYRVTAGPLVAPVASAARSRFRSTLVGWTVEWGINKLGRKIWNKVPGNLGAELEALAKTNMLRELDLAAGNAATYLNLGYEIDSPFMNPDLPERRTIESGKQAGSNGYEARRPFGSWFFYWLPVSILQRKSDDNPGVSITACYWNPDKTIVCEKYAN